MSGPRTHALLVGVGGYDHPEGKIRLGEDEATWSLAPLESPARTARALADWLEGSYRNPDAPLGSVELLTAPARWSDFDAAFKRWFQRCHSDEGNVALFYFCGHGVAGPTGETTSLLLQDFGADAMRAFDGAVDWNDTYAALRSQCRARRQYSFIDACRTFPADYAPRRGLWGRPVLDGVALGSAVGAGQPMDAPIYHACSVGEQSYGDPDGVSVFGGVLLRALNGLGAAREGRGWAVDSLSLAGALQRLLRDAKQDSQTPALGGECTGRLIHVLDGPPLVPTTVGCAPREASDAARFELSCQNDSGLRYSREPAPGAWKQEVRAEVYTLRARFPQGGFKNARRSVYVAPPSAEECLDVLLP